MNLEVVSECVVESAAEDECCGELGEGEVELGSSFPASAEAAVVVEPGVGAFDRPALTRVFVADASASAFPFARDVRADAAFLERVAEPVGVVAAVGEEPARPVLAAASTDTQPWYRVDRGERVHAIVPVSRPEQQR
jgi:hypothetical protein